MARGPARMGTAGLVALAALLASPAAAALTFTEAEDDAGVQWRHASVDFDEDHDGMVEINYAETTGSGACWGDVDGDGTDDLYLVNGKYHNASVQAMLDPRSALYLNEGDGTFTDVSQAWGADLSGWGQGCNFVDHDGDGDHDLLVVGWDMLHLMRNEGGRFRDVTTGSNLTLDGKCGEYVCFGESGAWADYDRDGDLDLYVANMVNCPDLGCFVSPTAPGNDGQPNQLWRNRGDGTFEDVTAAAGVDDDPGPDHSKSFMSLWADHDRDGDPDLYIASDTTANTLFRNNADGTFTDVAIAAGVDDERSSMGLVFQDVDADGRPDLFMTHYQGEDNGFYTNDGDGTFTDHSGEGELGQPPPQFHYVGWGAGFHDFDHDGDNDIYAVNGHTAPMLDFFEQTARLWLQGPGLNFTEVTEDAGPSFSETSVARGSAASDYDLDGDLDLVVVDNYNNTARLFRHGGAPAGTHWLQVEARQPNGANRFALGAEVTITPEGGLATTRVLQAGSSFLSQDSLVVHAGLGAAGRADVRVRWPDGLTETWTDVAADQRVRVVRGAAAVVRDTLSPRTTLTLEGEGRDGWFRTPVVVRLDAVDRSMGQLSGVARSELDTGAGFVGYEGPFTVDGQGFHPLAARSVDAAGNVEPPRLRPVRIDTVPPSTAATAVGPPGEDGWFLRTAAVRFEPADALSGVARVRWRLDGGAWQEGLQARVDGGGAHVVEFHAEDVAGNAEAVQRLEVKVDDAPPEVRVAGGPVAAGLGRVLVEAVASDAASGVARVAFFVGDEAAPRAVDADGSDGWGFTLAEPGAHRVRAVAADVAGFEAADEGLFAVAPAPPLPPLGLLLLGALPWAARRR